MAGNRRKLHEGFRAQESRTLANFHKTKNGFCQCPEMGPDFFVALKAPLFTYFWTHFRSLTKTHLKPTLRVNKLKLVCSCFSSHTSSRSTPKRGQEMGATRKVTRKDGNYRKLSGPVRDTPPYRAIPFRDSIADGGIAPICLVFIGYRASIAEIPLLHGWYRTSTSHALLWGNPQKRGRGYRTQLAMLRQQNPIARNGGASLR